MNWTGGRLQRHSKANANAVVKKQRQHFARARLQLQNGQKYERPSQPSIYGPRYGFDHSGLGPFEQNDVSLGRRPPGYPRQRSDHLDHGEAKPAASDLKRVFPIHKDGHKRRISNGHNVGPATWDQNQLIHGRDRPSPEDSSNPNCEPRSNRKFTNDEPTTLGNLRRRLLNSSDWMGLSAVRPPKIEFPSPEELHIIGKRRKISHEDRAKQKRLYDRYEPEPSLDNNLRATRHPERPPRATSKDYSIRVGGEIHQSQTTQLQSQQKQSQSQSECLARPMLPDTEAKHLTATSRSANHDKAIARNSNSRDELPRAPLIPLNEVLDTNDFDQVKARSNSLSPAKRPRRGIESQPSPKLLNESGEVNLPHGNLTSTYPSSPPFEPYRQNNFNFQDVSETGRHRYSYSMKDVSKVPISLRPSTANADQGFSPIPNSSGSIDSINKSNSTLPPQRTSSHHQVQSESQSFSTSRLYTLDHQAQLDSRLRESQQRRPSSTEFVVPDATSSDNQNPVADIHPLPSWITIESLKSERERHLNHFQPFTTSNKHQHISPEQKGFPHNRHDSTRLTQAAQVQDTATDAIHPQESDTRSSALDLFSRQATDAAAAALDISASIKHGNDAKAQKRARGSSRSGRSDNEKWMDFIFGQNHQQVKNTLEREMAALPKLSHARVPRESIVSSLLSEAAWTSSQQEDTKSTKTGKTAANTVLHRPGKEFSRNRLEPSETDFLSWMSPMTGYLDERMGGISVYNNPARSKRSFVAMLSQDTNRRKAAPVNTSQHFLSDFGPEGGRSDSSPLHQFRGHPEQFPFQRKAHS